MIFMTSISSFFCSKSDKVDRATVKTIRGITILIQPKHTCCLEIYAKIATPLREAAQSWHTDKRTKIRPLTYIIWFRLTVEKEAWSSGRIGCNTHSAGDG